MSEIDIMGNTVNLADFEEAVEEGRIITDIVVLARVVDVNNGRPTDQVMILADNTCTGLVQSGMINDIKVLMDEATRRAGYEPHCLEGVDLEDDEDD